MTVPDPITAELISLSRINGKIDERVFNLGVTLGRQLEAQGTPTLRLPFFAEQDKDWTEAETVLSIAEDVNDELASLVRRAYQDHLSRHFSVRFAPGPEHRRYSRLDDEAVARFNIQHVYTLQEDNFDDFDLAFTVTGPLAGIMQRHDVKTGFEINLRNNHGRTSKSITQRESLDGLFHDADLLVLSKGKSLLDYYAFAHELRRFCKTLTFPELKHRHP